MSRVLPHTAAAVLLLVLHTAILVQGQVSLSLGATPLANNSVVLITDIGDAATGGSPLICTTTFRPCCQTPGPANDGRHGHWHYPDESMVDNFGAGRSFYRNRGDDGTVRLHRRYNVTSPTGTYYCEIPGNSATDLQRLTVRAVTELHVLTTEAPTTGAPTTTEAPTTEAPTTEAPTTGAPTNTEAPTTEAPTTTGAPTTEAPTTTGAPTTEEPTTETPTTSEAPTTEAATTEEPSAPSGPPQSLTVTSTTPFTISIQWGEMECLEQNSVITGYSVRYGGMTTSLTGASNRTFTASGLTPRTNYTFEVAAVSVSGTGPPAMDTMVTDVSESIGLLLNGQLYPNNSIVDLDEIGEGSAALFCLTNKTDCCRSSDTVYRGIGDWSFPNGSVVNNHSSGSIYRTRGPSMVRLHRWNNVTTGVFSCEIPDASGANQTLYVGVYPVGSGSPSITGLLYNQTTLTLTCTSTGGPATNVTWRRDGAIVDNSNFKQSQRVLDTITSTYENLLVLTGRPENVIGNYSCSVRNARVQNYVESEVRRIQGLQLSGQVDSLLVGVQSSINCSTDLDAVTIEWLDSGGRVLANQSDGTFLPLVLSSVTSDHHNYRQYTCRVNSSTGSQEKTIITVTVLDSAQSSLLVGVVGGVATVVIALLLATMVVLIAVMCVLKRRQAGGNKGSSGSYMLADNAAYGDPAKRNEANVDSTDYDDVKFGCTDDYEEISLPMASTQFRYANTGAVSQASPALWQHSGTWQRGSTNEASGSRVEERMYEEIAM